MIKDLYRLVNELRYLYEISYNNIKPQVLYIIKNNIQDTNLIEHTLDSLLDIPTDKGYQLFTEFCNYISTFNKEIANDYINIYDELYDINSKIKKKNNGLS